MNFNMLIIALFLGFILLKSYSYSQLERIVRNTKNQYMKNKVTSL